MRFVKATIVIFIVAMVMAYGLLPRPELQDYITHSKAYFDREDRLIRLTLAEDQRYRIYQELGSISPELVQATILYEDQDYYQHAGIDVFALIRAFWTTYVLQERRVGASTITMQVARLRWGIASNTISGKLYQIFRSIQLTLHYSKQEILEFYLNHAPYGRNIEGIATASLIYFNKKPDQLSLPEALTLAVIPQNPNKRNPTTADGFQQLTTARKLLFERWLEHHPEDINKAKYLDLPLNIRPPEKLPFSAPHFINYLNNRISKWDGGYVHTTLDLSKQKTVENIIQSYVDAKASIGINNATALLVNYQTMSVEAMVGSANFHDQDIHGQVNGISAKRSPGSALKPFVYALAIDEGLVHPMSLVKDSPRKYGGFTPENYDKQFSGPLSVKQALIQSRNVPAVDLQSRLQSKSFYRFLKQAGIAGLKEESFYGLALALGGGEVSMMEIASLYSSLANQGVMKSIKSIRDESSEPDRRLLSREASYLTLDILKDNPPPDGLEMFLDNPLKNDVAWKTGTSWAFRDAWSVAISRPYVLVVWVGNFDGKGNDAFVGRSAAGPLLFSILRSVYPEQGGTFSDEHSVDELNLKKLQVCTTTGDLYEKDCPYSETAWFIPGVSPIKVSNIYRKIPINKTTGLRACWHQEGISELKVYEFWPSDFLQVFQQAGISLKIPPEYEAHCELDLKSASGQMPVITSPQSSIEYAIAMNARKNKNRQIPFKAIVDPDVVKLHWFVDDEYIGSSPKNEALIWQADPGEFHVRAVDDSGRGSSKMIIVKQIP